MDNEEKKAWEDVVDLAEHNSNVFGKSTRRAILAADAELSQLSAIEKRCGDVEGMAKLFHAAYERLAPQFGYRTRDDTACPWVNVPDDNRRLMIATVETVRGYLLKGEG